MCFFDLVISFVSWLNCYGFFFVLDSQLQPLFHGLHNPSDIGLQLFKLNYTIIIIIPCIVLVLVEQLVYYFLVLVEELVFAAPEKEFENEVKSSS